VRTTFVFAATAGVLTLSTTLRPPRTGGTSGQTAEVAPDA
jgi:hypothetical protein